MKREQILKILIREFPQATVGLDNQRPYAKLPDGQLFGILFDEEVDPDGYKKPYAIVRFPYGHLSAHNYYIYKVLEV